MIIVITVIIIVNHFAAFMGGYRIYASIYFFIHLIMYASIYSAHKAACKSLAGNA